MANHTFDTWMKNTVSVLEDRMIRANIIDPTKEKLTYQIGSPTYGNSHYIAVKDLEHGGEKRIFSTSPTVKRDEFKHAVSTMSWLIECSIQANLPADQRNTHWHGI